uniref:Uncharacterized protein n=1 Tax=Arundo donax TaxID=35708 RepID=A0A0A9DBE9_ARUDO
MNEGTKGMESSGKAIGDESIMGNINNGVAGQGTRRTSSRVVGTGKIQEKAEELAKIILSNGNGYHLRVHMGSYDGDQQEV